MEALGLGVQLCGRAWLAEGPETLTTIPSKIAVHWLCTKSDVRGQTFPSDLPGKASVIAYGWA